MTNVMAHEDAREALGALALDALDALERSAVLAHVADCASCRDELVALRETASQLTYVVRPVPMSNEQRARIRARLITRAGMERVAAVPSVSAPALSHAPLRILEPSAGPRHVAMARHTPASPPPLVLRPAVIPHDAVLVAAHRMEARARWIAAAAIVVAVASVFALVEERSASTDMRVQLQMAAVEARADGRVMDSLRNGVVARDKMIANITGADVAVVTLASSSPRAPSARMFWDQSVNAWTFVAHNLPQPRSGRAYQVWLVTATSKISAGTFAPNGSGDAVVHATYSLPRDALAAVAVTEEPAQGSAQPTTVPFIVGAAKGR